MGRADFVVGAAKGPKAGFAVFICPPLAAGRPLSVLWNAVGLPSFNIKHPVIHPAINTHAQPLDEARE